MALIFEIGWVDFVTRISHADKFPMSSKILSDKNINAKALLIN